MFVITDARNRVLLDDGSWDYVLLATSPILVFPNYESAQDHEVQMNGGSSHPAVRILSLQSLYAEVHESESKRLAEEKREISGSTLVALAKEKVFNRVRDSEIELVFNEFKVTHLIVSQEKSVLGVVGETDDPHTPFHSYVGDAYESVFYEEECYAISEAQSSLGDDNE